jgi:SAM-dependent methyltransferase
MMGSVTPTAPIARDRPARACWCGARSADTIWSGRYWKGRIAHAALDRCRECGTVRTGALTGIAVGSGDGPGGTFVNLEPSGWEQVNAPLIVRHHRPGPLLEVGANTGMLLGLLRALGLDDLRGLEPNPACAAAARGRGERVEVGWFDSTYTVPRPLASIVMSHVFEHIDDPLAALDLAAESLLAGGRLLLFVPNIDSRAARRDLARWKPLNPVDHIWHFSPDTLGKLVARNGKLEVLECLTTPLAPPRWSSPARIYRSVRDRRAARAGSGEQLVCVLGRR